MKHPVSRELYWYWDTLRGARAAPERSALDPAAIRGILANTFVLGVEPEHAVLSPRILVRLSGTRLNALFNRELKGQNLPMLWRETDRSLIEDLIAGVQNDARGVVAHVKAAPAGYSPVDLELLLLPLRHHGRTHARLLGALAPVVNPSWLGLLPVEPLELASFRTALAAPTEPRTSRDDQPNGKRHAHLTVYQSNFSTLRSQGPEAIVTEAEAWPSGRLNLPGLSLESMSRIDSIRRPMPSGSVIAPES